MLQELESQVLEIYGEADRAVARYRQATGLSCSSGCLKCCNSEKVEATAAEMIPLAFHLFRTGQAELLMKRLEKEEARQCILFRPDLSTDTTGGCSQYSFRALVCRLFGYAGNPDRTGQPQLARCREMHPVPPENQLRHHAGLMPLFTTFGIAITAIHPALGTRRQPINEALYTALAKVGLLLAFDTGSANADEGVDLPPDTPASTPTPPRRKAA